MIFLSIMFTETILSHKTNREKFVTKSLPVERQRLPCNFVGFKI